MEEERALTPASLPYKLKRGAPSPSTLRVYPQRFLVCIAFGFNTIVNAMIWIAFAPVQERSAHLYNVSQEWINMLSISFQVLYVPGTFLCAYMFKHYGLRKSFLFASCLQFFGSILRYASVNQSFLSKLSSITTSWAQFPFFICFVGTCLAGLIQPFYTNSGARIAAEWFSVEGRDAATAVLTILNPFGIGLGSFLPTIWIQPIGDNNLYGGYSGYMLVQMVCALVTFFMTILFHKDKPPTPPSMSQRMKLSNLDKNRDNFNSKSQLRRDFELIANNREFFYLIVGFGVGLGVFNSLTTLINQYTAAFHYSSNDAGAFGGLLIAGGLVGAVVAGAAMEITRNYRKILKIFVTATLLVAIVFVTQMKQNNFIALLILFTLFGFCAIPIVAVTFECAAECTYPANEEVSSGLLMTAGSFTGSIFILIWGSFLPKEGKYYKNGDILNFSTIFILASVFITFLFLIMFKGDYRRLQMESQMENLVADMDSNVGLSNQLNRNPRNPIKKEKSKNHIFNKRNKQNSSKKLLNHQENADNNEREQSYGSAETFDIDYVTNAALNNKTAFIGTDSQKVRSQRQVLGGTNTMNSYSQGTGIIGSFSKGSAANVIQNASQNQNQNYSSRHLAPRAGKGSVNYSVESDNDLDRFETVSDDKSEREYSRTGGNNIYDTPVTHENIWDMQGSEIDYKQQRSEATESVGMNNDHENMNFLNEGSHAAMTETTINDNGAVVGYSPNTQREFESIQESMESRKVKRQRSDSLDRIDSNHDIITM